VIDDSPPSIVCILFHVSHYMKRYGEVEMTVGLLTNHGHVLVCVAGEPGMTLREIAECVGVTERTAHTIVCELERAGYLTRHREGRRNSYEVHPDAVLRHELEGGATVGELVAALAT
jgi:DNA-binding MarR family transcriptional regulator